MRDWLGNTGLRRLYQGGWVGNDWAECWGLLGRNPLLYMVLGLTHAQAPPASSAPDPCPALTKHVVLTQSLCQRDKLLPADSADL